jgi:hypothetical protein
MCISLTTLGSEGQWTVARQIRERVKQKLIEFFSGREWKTPLNVYEIALAFGREEPRETEHFWTEEYCGMLNRHIAKRLARPKEEKSFQMFLTGFRGDLMEPIELREGTIPIADATIRELRQNIKVFIKNFKAEAQAKSKTQIEAMMASSDAELERIVRERQRLIDEMAPYAHIYHGITVAKYCELRAAGISPEQFARARTQTRRANA